MSLGRVPLRTSPVLVLVLAGLLVGCSSGEPIVRSDDPPARAEGTQATPTTDPGPARPGHFSRRRAMTHVRALAGTIGVRVRATAGERRGARYIAREFRELGYDVFIQKFPVDGSTSRNVVARWPEARKYPIVIGGHMDSVPTSPGGNDNASGIAAILEIARIVRNTEQAGFLKFIAFGSEEFGTDGSHHVGSRVFVERLGPQGRRKLGGMLSVDMVADGRPLIVGTSGIGPDVLARHLYRKIEHRNIRVDYQTLCDCSDNGPFEHAGIPAGFLWSGDEPNYHDDSDTIANMVPADLERTGKALRAFVKGVGQALLDRLRRY